MSEGGINATGHFHQKVDAIRSLPKSFEEAIVAYSRGFVKQVLSQGRLA
jgi:hypothetical protein